MVTKTVDFPAITKTTGFLKQTGAFGPGDEVRINFKIPANADTMNLLIAQIQTDADMALTLDGKTKHGLLSSSFAEKAPAAGDRTAILTADGDVQDVNVHLTIQVERHRLKKG